MRSAAAGCLIAPNFSAGVAVFSRLVAEAGTMLARLGVHRPWIWEMHHTGKLDAPSGTARSLARTLLAVDPRLRTVQEGNPTERLADDALHVVSLRSGDEPGTHVVGFDGPYDRITLTHNAHGRAGFALGAVLAAEWIVGKPGLHRYEDVVAAWLEPRSVESKE
jgi:4-hydroxy-tetrahydrodipicolinate reductase